VGVLLRNWLLPGAGGSVARFARLSEAGVGAPHTSFFFSETGPASGSTR